MAYANGGPQVGRDEMKFCKDCTFSVAPEKDDKKWDEWVCKSPQVQTRLDSERKVSPVTGQAYPQSPVMCFIERGVDGKDSLGCCNMAADHFKPKA